MDSPRLQGEIRLVNTLLNDDFEHFLKKWTAEQLQQKGAD